jgi:hypothetical protein
VWNACFNSGFLSVSASTEILEPKDQPVIMQPDIQRTLILLKIQTRAEFKRFIHRVNMLNLAP